VAVADALVPLPQSAVRLIPSGPIPPNSASLLAQDGLADFERRVRNRFELVVYDSPPVSVGADASLLAATAEGAVMVVDARRTGRNALLQAVEQLRRANANVLGIVLNRTPDSSRTSYYYRSRPTAAEERPRATPPRSSTTPEVPSPTAAEQ
jgi:capsular exopolysaccharide synthesis family protein